MLKKFLVPNICHFENMMYIRKFTIANILGEIPFPTKKYK